MGDQGGIHKGKKDCGSGTVTVDGIWEQNWEEIQWEESAKPKIRAGVKAASPERNRRKGVDYSKETDKAPLTAASSCFLRLCHHMTPPLMFVYLSYYLFP